MAEPLNWILNDSQRAAKVYAGLIENSNVDSKMWDFVNIRKNHEQIVGDVKQKLTELGLQPTDKSRNNWPDISKHKALRLYEDADALLALREAEQAELEDCEKLLSMSKDQRLAETFVSGEVMPVLRDHIEILDRYLKSAKNTRH